MCFRRLVVLAGPAAIVMACPAFVAEADEMLLPVRPELALSAEPVVALEAGWADPPRSARTRCWWWWLNGNQTKEGVTRDLEQMRRQGLGGANIIDAGGAEQRGHRQVPHGPDFGSPEWLGLFKHALSEADRLELELGLNIQSGWNLGGPTVTPDQAAKKLTWTETTLRGGADRPLRLKTPPTVAGYYRDVAVLALPVTGDRSTEHALSVEVDSSQPGHEAALLLDGDPETFWVSGTYGRGEGPNLSQPHRVDFTFAASTPLTRLVIHPRPGYGPKRGWVQASNRPQSWRLIGRWESRRDDEAIVVDLEPTSAERYRLIIADAYDPRSPAAPRNVQVAEVELFDGDVALHRASSGLARVDNYRQKAYHDYPGPFTATKSDHLLRVGDGDEFERTLSSGDAIDLTDRLGPGGRLDWDAPPGVWTVLRLGYTLAGSRVSTHSENGGGWAIDYLDRDAFQRYWGEVVDPILAAAGPSVGRSLRFLHTDSWELGPINWTPALLEAFERRRGYDARPYLPVLAGFVVEDRERSNRFLNDFRRTLADLIADGKYAAFREAAHDRGLGVHPESGGPHAAPIDALQCLGRNDIPMGEFWARSRTHRVNDYERLFVKQSASAAHTYGRRLVMAEAFTSIGPQWEKDPSMLKPVFDRVACEGLNLVMLHTFAASPPEMGLPGQAYFAGTHINPNVTWWDLSGGFFDYLNRCQFLLQQGLPVADVLHFYGENVPGFVRLKNDNPAGDLTGYGYDVTNAETLLARVRVADGKLVLPEGTGYEVLSLPPGGSYGLAALRKIAELVDEGATVVGSRPDTPMGLVDDDDAEEFARLTERLWGPNGPVRDESARDALRRRGVALDFDAGLPSDPGDEPQIDYFHRRTDDEDIYFVANRTAETLEADCRFRVAGREPELWDPVSGETRTASTYAIDDGATRVPLRLEPEQASFVVFRREAPEPRRDTGPNLPRVEPTETLDLAWEVAFDPALGGPAESVAFPRLSDWSRHDSPAIRYYSGKAVYTATWRPGDDLVRAVGDRRCWLDLGEVKNVAAVSVDGEPCGIVWTPPYRVELPGGLQEAYELRIEVANLWPNRLIGDARLPESERVTSTNIRKFGPDAPLLPSGLLGPVKLLVERHGDSVAEK